MAPSGPGGGRDSERAVRRRPQFGSMRVISTVVANQAGHNAPCDSSVRSNKGPVGFSDRELEGAFACVNANGG